MRQKPQSHAQHGFKHESHRNQSSNPFKALSFADAFIFTFPCPRFSNSIVRPSQRGTAHTHQKHSPIFNAAQKTASSSSTPLKRVCAAAFRVFVQVSPSLSLRSAQRISYLAFFSPLLPRYSTSTMLKLCGRVA